jgi:hypothetical protein
MPWDNSSLNARAVMADASVNRRQTIRIGAGVAFAQVGIVGFDGQIELEALRLFGLPEVAPAVLYACPSVPIGTRSLALETTWDLPSLTAGATANIDVTVPGARRGDFADASLDTSSIAFVLDCHVWSNNSLRVPARNVSASTVDLAAARLSVQMVNQGWGALMPRLPGDAWRTGYIPLLQIWLSHQAVVSQMLPPGAQ